MPRTHSLSEDKSTLLHAIRWMAGLVVLLGHTQMYARQRTEHDAFPFAYIGEHAHAAVVVFFVLSGFVIAWCVDRDIELSWKKYYVDRFTRIYSVLPLALVFTMMVDVSGGMFSAAYRDSHLIPQDHFLLRLAVNLFSVQGFQGYRVQFGSNPALWSIGYEFFYYVVFGLLFFRKIIFGARAFLAPLVAILLFVLAGQRISLYFLIWLLGAIVYRLQSRMSIPQAYFWPALLLVFASNHWIVYRQALPGEFLNDLVLALSLAVLLVCTPPSIPCKRMHRTWADFSYTLYALHMPVLFFLYFVIYVPGLSVPIFSFLNIVCALLISWAMSHVAENKRYYMRAWINRFPEIQSSATTVGHSPSPQ